MAMSMGGGAGQSNSLAAAEFAAAATDDPARTKHAAEQVVTGASPDAIKAFSDMQAQSYQVSGNETSGHRSWWRRLLRRS